MINDRMTHQDIADIINKLNRGMFSAVSVECTLDIPVTYAGIVERMIVRSNGKYKINAMGSLTKRVRNKVVPANINELILLYKDTVKSMQQEKRILKLAIEAGLITYVSDRHYRALEDVVAKCNEDHFQKTVLTLYKQKIRK